MASPYVAKILSSKSDLSPEKIESISDADAWKIIYSLTSTKVRDDRIQLCFTGFDPDQKQVLVDYARANKCKVRGSVTKKLDYLICGEYPGPVKIEKARSQGAKILTASEFMDLIDKNTTKEH